MAKRRIHFLIPLGGLIALAALVDGALRLRQRNNAK